MPETPETGYLVIADLTGYTAYLTRGELEHAPTIAGDLLETIVGRLEPPFRLTKFEGDAAFLFVEDGRADASLLLDAIEASYVAFRRRLRSIKGATTCGCNACSLAPELDLKLFVHHGSYVRSRIAGRDELAGREVILVHRLLKSATAADARDKGFALFTDDAVTALGLDPGALGLTEAKESIEHLGEVVTFVLDLESRWQVESRRRRLDATHDRVLFDLALTIPAGPADVWAHLTSPSLRPLWEGPIVIEEASPGGWRGVGTTAQCVTGRLTSLEEIVDWQPFDHIGWRLAVPDIGPIEATVDFDAVEGGTHVRLRWAASPARPVDDETINRTRTEKAAALERLPACSDVAWQSRPIREEPLDIRTAPRFAGPVRIGQLARQVGVSTDTVRFYERSGFLPRASRRDNDYREYADADAEHLRLLIDLRRLEIPLEDAARIASWCHSGHCADTSAALPSLIAARRAEIAGRIAGLESLDARLAGLERHLTGRRRSLTVLGESGSCCEAAGAVVGSVDGGCACCSTVGAY